MALFDTIDLCDSSSSSEDEEEVIQECQGNNNVYQVGGNDANDDNEVTVGNSNTISETNNLKFNTSVESSSFSPLPKKIKTTSNELLSTNDSITNVDSMSKANYSLGIHLNGQGHDMKYGSKTQYLNPQTTIRNQEYQFLLDSENKSVIADDERKLPATTQLSKDTILNSPIMKQNEKYTHVCVDLLSSSSEDEQDDDQDDIQQQDKIQIPSHTGLTQDLQLLSPHLNSSQGSSSDDEITHYNPLRQKISYENHDTDTNENSDCDHNRIHSKNDESKVEHHTNQSSHNGNIPNRNTTIILCDMDDDDSSDSDTKVPNDNKFQNAKSQSYYYDCCDDSESDSDLFSPTPFHPSRLKQQQQRLQQQQPESQFTNYNCEITNISNSKHTAYCQDKENDRHVVDLTPPSTKSKSILLNDDEINMPVQFCNNTFNSPLLSPQPLHPSTSITDTTTAPHTSSATTTPSKAHHVPTPPLPFININEIGGKLYPDLKNQFIKSLISHAKVTRRVIQQRGAFDASIRAINVIALYPFPLRSAEATTRLKGVGSDLLAVLKESEKSTKQRNKSPYNPPRGKFSSTAAAALVSLLRYSLENVNQPLCPMENLIATVNQLTHNSSSSGGTILNREVAYYLDKDILDPGWMQIKKLCTSNSTAGLECFVKERRKKDLCPSGIVFELLENGKECAIRLEQTLNNSHTTPPAGPLRQLASHSVDEAFGNVTMSVDFREGGGGGKGLHKMCDLLDDYQVPYVVRDLKISDYIFFVGNKLAPILIERKSVDDVAGSLADGRWERQQRNMRKAQYVLGEGEERKCQICYIIEGDASRRTVHGGRVGRAAWGQSLRDVEDAIDKLPSLGFSVMTSKSHMGSMNILAQVARDVYWKAQNGSITCRYSYAEFLREVNNLDASKGDPPTNPAHMNPAPPVVNSASSRDSTTRVNPNLDVMNPNETNDNNAMNLSSIEEVNENEEQNNQRIEEMKKLSIDKLKEMCKDRDEKISGSKMDLIHRLLQPRKPEILISRSRRGQYIPKFDSCNAAILIALLLNHIPGTEGLSKERIMLLAEETGVNKDPMGGNGGWYDGWSGIKDMVGGDPPLISVVKRKYALTTQPPGSCGRDVAQAIHVMVHRLNRCRCGSNML